MLHLVLVEHKFEVWMAEYVPGDADIDELQERLRDALLDAISDADLEAWVISTPHGE